MDVFGLWFIANIPYFFIGMAFAAAWFKLGKTLAFMVVGFVVSAMYLGFLGGAELNALYTGKWDI